MQFAYYLNDSLVSGLEYPGKEKTSADSKALKDPLTFGENLLLRFLMKQPWDVFKDWFSPQNIHA